MLGNLEPEHWWWIAGVLLLGLEIASPGIYFLFFGIAALVVGTNAFFLPGNLFAVSQQLIAFATVSAAAIYLGGRWYRSGRSPRDNQPDNPARRLIGRETRLVEPILSGRGRAKIGDSWWTVEGPDLPEGTRVRVRDVKASILMVDPVEAARPPETR